MTKIEVWFRYETEIKVVPSHKVAIIAAIFLKIKIAAPNEAAENVITY